MVALVCQKLSGSIWKCNDLPKNIRNVRFFVALKFCRTDDVMKLGDMFYITQEAMTPSLKNFSVIDPQQHDIVFFPGPKSCVFLLASTWWRWISPSPIFEGRSEEAVWTPKSPVGPVGLHQFCFCDREWDGQLANFKWCRISGNRIYILRLPKLQLNCICQTVFFQHFTPEG